MPDEAGGQSFFSKYKWWIIAGGGVVVVFIYIQMNGGIGAGSSSSTGSAVTTVPDTTDTSQLQNISSTQAQELGGISQIQSDLTAPSTSVEGITLGGAPGLPNNGIWSTQVATFGNAQGTQSGPNIPYGSYALEGTPVQSAAGTLYPIQGPGGGELWALGENVQGTTTVNSQQNTVAASTSSTAAG